MKPQYLTIEELEATGEYCPEAIKKIRKIREELAEAEREASIEMNRKLTRLRDLDSPRLGRYGAGMDPTP